MYFIYKDFTHFSTHVLKLSHTYIIFFYPCRVCDGGSIRNKLIPRSFGDMMLLTLLQEGRNSLLRETGHTSKIPSNQNIKEKSLEDLILSNKNIGENRAFVYNLLNVGFQSFISGLFPKQNPIRRCPTNYIPVDDQGRKSKMLKVKRHHLHKIRHIAKKRI